MDPRRTLRAHLDSRQVSRVIYGSIIGLAVILALKRHPPAPGAVVATMLGTALAVALAELYSELIGGETRTRKRPDRARLRATAVDALFVAVGIAVPVIYFLLDVVGVLDLDSAFLLAQWTGLGLIVFYGLCGARLAGAGWPRAAVEGVALGLIGALLILLKAFVH